MAATSLMNNVWLVIGIWLVVYLGDYYGTIYGARLYLEGAQQYITFEGSYELNPIFQRDVDSLRRFSPRFLLMLVLSCVLLLAAWYTGIEDEGSPWLFQLMAGALILRGMVLVMRHARNIAMFRMVARGGGMKGNIEQARWLVLMQSAMELLGFGVLFVLLAPLGPVWFFLGGSLSCCMSATRNWISARRLLAPSRADPAA